uniref:RNA polymerase II subunit A C-terminal domain phosphatase SSU72 n=1 Tax=Capra hircus TaxID=9925 RepID=A0A8C2PIA9_CAPHI
ISSSTLRVAVVCKSNMNRNMEAHSILKKKGCKVRSFGVGSCVTLPGLAPNLPQMHKDLLCKNRMHYRNNGLLQILGRNERIQPGPERFQERIDPFDVIFTCAERVYKVVVKDLCAREQKTWQPPVHVINVEIEDTLEAAALGALIICELCQGLQQEDNMQSSLPKLLQAAKKKTGKSFLHTICFY